VLIIVPSLTNETVIEFLLLFEAVTDSPGVDDPTFTLAVGRVYCPLYNVAVFDAASADCRLTKNKLEKSSVIVKHNFNIFFM